MHEKERSTQGFPGLLFKKPALQKRLNEREKQHRNNVRVDPKTGRYNYDQT